MIVFAFSSPVFADDKSKIEEAEKSKIKGKEFVIIRIAVQVEERKVADDRDDYNCKCQKDKRMEVPMHDEWPANETVVFDLHRSGTKPKETQGNHEVNKITDVSPVNQFANHVLLATLFAGKILDVYKKYLGNREQYKVMCKVCNQKFFVHVALL